MRGLLLHLVILSDTHRHTHTYKHTHTRYDLSGWPAMRRNLYLTTHNSHKTETTMPPARFEPAIPASERPQTHTLDHAATGIGANRSMKVKYKVFSCIYLTKNRVKTSYLGVQVNCLRVFCTTEEWSHRNNWICCTDISLYCGLACNDIVQILILCFRAS